MGQTIRFKRWNLLSEATRELGAVTSVDAMWELLRAKVRAILRSDGVAVILRDDDEVHYLGIDAIAPLWADQRFPVSTCVSGMAMTDRAPIVIPDIRNDSRVPLNLYLSTFVSALAVYPVGTPEPVAALAAYWKDAGPIEPDALSLMDMLVASANATLQRLAVAAESQRAAG